MTVHPLCPALATAERRQMVVMFCDIAGSSALAARMDAESFGALIVAYRRLVAATVERHGGRVARYVGDGVLACWGHPRARDDDAQRALAAALAIRAAFAPSGPHALSLRIALDAGFVIVGDLAAGAAQSADVVGEAPNAAAELQAAAAPGEALVTDSLRALAGHAFVFESLGERRLKARAAPEAVFRLA
ncbi:MAG: adenylate/guanylate cyclase domain-containing protein, partial [Methylobacteriaceae bacterium]|nr:adenylate/guanylate cyclase domain-containing protein [Methylobacteriaceae bacterium]